MAGDTADTMKERLAILNRPVRMGDDDDDQSDWSEIEDDGYYNKLFGITRENRDVWKPIAIEKEECINYAARRIFYLKGEEPKAHPMDRVVVFYAHKMRMDGQGRQPKPTGRFSEVSIAVVEEKMLV